MIFSFYNYIYVKIKIIVTFQDQKLEAEFQTVGRVGGSVYRDYFLANAPCLQALIVFFMFLLAQFCASTCDYWISRW